MVERLSSTLFAVLGWVLFCGMAALVCIVTWQIFARFVLGEPDPYTEEIARYLLLWLSLLGAAYACRTRAHIGISLLTDRASRANAERLERLVRMMVAIFALSVLVYGGGRLMLLVWELNQTSAALGVPMAAVYSILPLTGVLITIFGLAPANTSDDEECGESA